MTNYPGKPTDDIPLVLEDWCFDACPNEELYGCVFYEYARSSNLWLNMVEQERKQPGWKDVAKYLQELTSNSGRDYYEVQYLRSKHAHRDFLRFFPEYPNSPWLRVPAKKRSSRISAFTNKFHSLGCPPVRAASQTELQDLALGRPAGAVEIDIHTYQTYHVTPLALTFCWNFTDTDILEAIKPILSQSREQAATASKRGRSPCRHDVLKARLRDLGAFRILKHMSAEKAIRFTSNTSGQALYTTVRSWQRAKKSAQTLLSRFTLSGLPIEEEEATSDPLANLLGPSQQRIEDEEKKRATSGTE